MRLDSHNYSEVGSKQPTIDFKKEITVSSANHRYEKLQQKNVKEIKHEVEDDTCDTKDGNS
jgi:hypothetical protein